MPTSDRCHCGKYIPLPSCPAATFPLGHFTAPTCARLFPPKETGAPTAAAAQLVQGFAAFPLVTIGVTNTEVTSNSDADDGAAAQGMDCT